MLIPMSWAVALLTLQIPVGQVIAAVGRLWIGFAMNLAWAIVFLGSFFLLKEFGATGLAGALLIAYALHATWMSAFAYYF